MLEMSDKEKKEAPDTDTQQADEDLITIILPTINNG